MYRLIFKNRWFALGWVFLMIFSVVAFFGKGGGQEMLEQATDEVRAGSGPIMGPGMEEMNERVQDAGGFNPDTSDAASDTETGPDEEFAEESAADETG